MREKIALNHKWRFILDPENKGLEKKIYLQDFVNAEEVYIPHTYNVGNGTDDYRGIAWYQYAFDAADNWKDKNVEVYFEGLYRDADFWLNGKTVGKHYGSGFTTFGIDLSSEILAGEKNILTLRVDNSYSPYALPWFNQFDWADDGGVFRPVYILVTDKTSIKTALIDAIPKIDTSDGRKDEGEASIKCRIEMAEGALQDAIIFYELIDGGTTVLNGTLDDTYEIKVPYVKYWHFDVPYLYLLRLTVIVNSEVTDVYETKIGFRKFVTEGNEFVLNGEKVHLVGTEWMPGSDTRIGNAERPEDIERFLTILKGCNCIYTRVHWQQSDYFYQWCDEHGIMVQEEIPLWGQPNEPVTNTMDMVKKQCVEMLYSHYNHPSIVTWGVGNELNGQSEITKKYVTEAVKYFKTIDLHRPISFVSNTTWESPDDACTRSDIMMCNEYIGTWQMGYDNDESVKLFREVNNDKPMLISEFGLCEPAFSGGDVRRKQIFLDKVSIYRKYNVNGFIYFCLNDYRTQMGEDGTGRLRQRVHGSTDCYGNPKPSYYDVKRECAPIKVNKMEVKENAVELELEIRNDLPRYEVKEYYVQVSSIGYAPVIKTIPDSKPGDKVEMSLPIKGMKDTAVKIYRPTGDEVLNIKIK